ncbi:MAG: glycosyltransferase family 9 protein [bacterium]|nr:glycosyltransferase family 9 protein [bacterium]
MGRPWVLEVALELFDRSAEELEHARVRPREVSYPADSHSARRIIGHCQNPFSAPPRAERILIIRLGALGDVVRTLPSLAALRAAWPEAHLCWLVERGAAAVLEGQGDLDAVIEFPRESLTQLLRAGRITGFVRELRGFVQALRAERFDLVIDFHAILKSGLLSWSCGAPVRVSYARPLGREASWLFATHRARVLPGRLSRYDRNAALVDFLAIDPATPCSSLRVDPAARARVDRALDRHDEFALIHPGSSAGASHKRYRSSGYAACARDLFQARGLRSLVTRGTSDEERRLAEEIVSQSKGAAELAPQTSQLVELIALIDRARLFVGGDSGPLHIATAVSTPAVQILGPTDPIENEPRREALWRRVRMPVACSPCRRGCAAATCLAIIPHERIVDAALECLDHSVGLRRAALGRQGAAPPAFVAVP